MQRRPASASLARGDMTHSLKASRRTVLQLFAGPPLIPIARLTPLSLFGGSAPAPTRDAKDGDLYGRLPAPIAVLTLDQDKETGALKLVKYHTVDPVAVHGLWTTCGASISPWNTHLASEEYEPDATAIADNAVFRAYSQNLFGDPDKANPYHYCHVPEVAVAADGTGTLKKHY